MKLVMNIPPGLTLLRPSKRHYKLGGDADGSGWKERMEKGSARQNYPREVQVVSGASDVASTARPKSRTPFITPGTHEVERIENPLVPGGEPWLVLKGSRIGAAESYLRRMGIVTAESKTVPDRGSTAVATAIRAGGEAEAA